MPIGNSSVEPWFAVNPLDPLNLIATYQQDRWTSPDGGSRGVMTAWSSDGGLTWNPAPVPMTSLVDSGTFQRASDPWISFSPNGDAYQMTLVTDVTDAANGMTVSKSTDGGRTWSAPVLLIDDTLGPFNDKNSISADRLSSDYVYCVWDRDGVPYISRTANAGQTWLTAVPLVGGYADFTIGNQIVEQPDGTLYDFFGDYGASLTIRAMTSTDHGQTWSQTVQGPTLEGVGVYDPVEGQTLRVADELIAVAADPDNGNLYVVWGDARFSGGVIDEIAFSMSADNGHTWSTPIKINRTPTFYAKGERQAFLPSIAVGPDGTIAVAYYDFRNAAAGTPLWTDRWAVFCHPTPATPCTSSSSWVGEVRLTPTSFDFDAAPVSNQGRMVGDYFSMQSIGSRFTDVFGVTSQAYPSIMVDRTLLPYARGDFNRNLHSDLLFQNQSTGQLAVWYLNGASVTGGAYVTPAQDPAWRAVGTADLDGDGSPDIVFQNRTSGQLAVWYMSGTSATSGAYISPTPPAGWQAVGVDDLTPDGRTAMLLQNTSTSQLSIWYLNNSVQVGGAFIDAPLPSGWTAAGLADLNGDGQPDIVLFNPATGGLGVWYMYYTTVMGAAYITPSQAPGWTPVAMADLTGDWIPDIVFQNTSTGQLAVWYMSGANAQSGALINAGQATGWLGVGPH